MAATHKQKIKLTPWDLTQREVDTLRAILRMGCNKLAADVLNITEKTVESHACSASKQMRASGGFRTRLHCLLAFYDWDRLQREAERPAVQVQRFDEAGERI